jgi:hypothetical protein
VVDVFAMPQSGTGVSVEAVDPVFQTKMLDMLKQCGRCAYLSLLPQVCASHALLRLRRRHLCMCAGQRWWSAGTTATQASAAGSPASTSTRSRCYPILPCVLSRRLAPSSAMNVCRRVSPPCAEL